MESWAYIYLLMRHASSKWCILPTYKSCDHSQDSLSQLEDEAEPKMFVVSSLSSIIIMLFSFRDETVVNISRSLPNPMSGCWMTILIQQKNTVLV